MLWCALFSQKALKEAFSGQKNEKPFIQKEIISDNITKNGTIIYRVDSCAIRDDGDVLNISRGYSDKGVETALRMAINRYEGCITVNGSVGFKEQVVHIAAHLKLNMKFN